MLDMRFIREHANEVKLNVKRRRADVDIDALLRLDDERLVLLREVESLRKERNEIAETMKTASEKERPKLIQRGKELKELIAAKELGMSGIEVDWKNLMMRVPNLTHPDAPVGVSDADNVEIKRVGKVRKLDFKPKSHMELAEMHDLIDFTRAAKVSGAKFYFLKGKLALLEQALVQWTLREMAAEGYLPMTTPDLAKDEVLIGTGFNPRGPETQTYSIEGSDLSLIGTAEIALGGYHKDEILDEEKVPLKYVGLSHCYRTEAGAYGRESYGLYRVHQFTKVEMFVYAAPGQSDALLLEMERLSEMLFTKLEIPFRVVEICTGDFGNPHFRKFDIEAWMWGKGEKGGDWGEVTSASNCTDFQARRLNIRLRKKDGSIEFAHTLNNTAMSMARALIAILENHQQADGTVSIPEVLRPFCGFDKIG